MKTPLRFALAALACVAAAPPPAAEAPALHRTFLSPFGEPFRPGPDAADPFDAWFARVDANHDGRIEREELRADARAFFKILDANGDGRVDGFELYAYEHKIAPEILAGYDAPMGVGPERGEGPRGGGRARNVRFAGGGPSGEPPEGGGPRRGYLALLNEPEPVSGADFDLDSKVTADEWLRAADRRFDLLDAARTGALTREALLARFAKPGKLRRR